MRRMLLWQPGPGGRLVLFGVGLATIALVAWVHVATGTAYEFYVFFAPPIIAVS